MTDTDARDTVTISGHTDPTGEAPWAMQLVMRAEKAALPTRTAVCEATAIAVVTLLADPRARNDWAAEIDRWLHGRIRKHFRRARGAAWDRLADHAGVTIDHAGASVRAFVPSATDTIPRDIAKLQLSGSELDDPNKVVTAERHPGGPLIVTVQPDPFLPLGKAAAACGHAAQVAWMEMPTHRRAAWAAHGFPVRVEQPDKENWHTLVPLSQVQIADAGFTVCRPGTLTALARWA